MKMTHHMLGDVFGKLGAAAGPDALADTCATLTEALVQSTEALARACKAPGISTIRDLTAAVTDHVDAMTHETPPADIIAIIDLVDDLDAALNRLGLAMPVNKMISTGVAA